MESPKFIICPECNERYNDSNKRRLIDTCGHPRCYSCLFKDNPCPVCSKLPHRRERARTLSNEKLLEEKTNNERNLVARHRRYPSDTAATFTGMFRKATSKEVLPLATYISFRKPKNLKETFVRDQQSGPKDSYLRTLYSYDPGSKAYNMEEKIRRYKSLEILNDKTRHGSISSEFSSDVFVSPQDSYTDQHSLSSSIDELDEGSRKSPTTPDPPQEKLNKTKRYPMVWPSCPDLSIQENIWQMRPAIERRKRPSSLHQSKYSTNSPRSSVYSPRSSGYWSELEQLSESESFTSATPKHLTEILSPLSQDLSNTEDNSIETSHDSQSISQAPTSETKSPGRVKEAGINNNFGAWKITRGVFQQWRPKSNRTRSTECLRQDAGENVRQKVLYRVQSIPAEYHSKKFSENNVQKQAFMTDV